MLHIKRSPGQSPTRVVNPKWSLIRLIVRERSTMLRILFEFA